MATDTNNTETSTRARIVNVGKRAEILALEVTLSNGEVFYSKGNRAVKAEWVSVNAPKSNPTDLGWSTHARHELAASYCPTGSKYADQWLKVEVVKVERDTVADIH